MSKSMVACKSAAVLMASMALAAVVVGAQTPSNGSAAGFTATTDNVAGKNDSIRIDLLRWSTDAERDQLASAWTQPNPPAGRGGRGGAGRGANAPADAPFGAGNDPVAGAAAAPAAAAGRGGAGRGGRGGRGGDAPPAAPRTPEAALADAVLKAPVVGYLWSSEVAGYALHYAVRMPEQGGGERIILITDRRLGAWNDLWKPVGSDAVTNYEFSVIELHVNSKGEGEGKASLTGKVTFDSAAKTFGLENYGAAPVILKGVKRRTS
ncbi:MAG TPA: hypothetical protein VN841_23085 [Bryobacteraceae bacterium]|nr:hypothetical protein [Bryobacteraceae bacterium]